MEHIGAVNGLGNMQPARRMKAAYRMSEGTPAAKDTVELSSVMNLRGVEGGIRLDRVMAVRSEIEAGTYFTAEKFGIALDRALDQIFSGR